MTATAKLAASRSDPFIDAIEIYDEDLKHQIGKLSFKHCAAVYGDKTSSGTNNVVAAQTRQHRRRLIAHHVASIPARRCASS
jgi:hypothetical protein